MTTSTFTLASALWAKTRRDPDTQTINGWLPLLVHLIDTGETAVKLLRHRVSLQQRHVLEDALPEGVALERLVWLLGATHDLGKAGAAFQSQDKTMSDELYSRTAAITGDPAAALDTRQAEPITSQGEFPHSLASEVILARVLSSDFGLTTESRASAFGPASPVALPIVRQLASMTGAHHGMTTAERATTKLIRQKPWPSRLGRPGTPWPEVQVTLARHLIAQSEVDFAAELWKVPDLQFDTAVLSLLTGLVIQADWIASNQDLFPLIALDQTINDCDLSTVRAASAWHRLRLPESWQPLPSPTVNTALHQRFALAATAQARPGQLAAFDATHNLDEPALVVIEDETGAGKTEAALLAAENLAQVTGASGVFVGLPTQATTNAIFSRVADWLRHLDTRADSDQVSVALAHGKSLLNSEYSRMPRVRPLDASDIADLSPSHLLPDSNVHAEAPQTGKSAKLLRPETHSWLSGRKKRILSDFVVGTIDQLLMASLKARHVMLRHNGFADKIVIIDEAHAADTTMRIFMHSALVWLGRLGAPTIVLTATLPPAQRHDLISAYQQGLAERAEATKTPTVSASSDSSPDSTDHAPDTSSSEFITRTARAYPLLTVATGSEISETPFAGRPPRSVELIQISDDDTALVTTARDLLSHGGCIAVIRNSVKRVQHAAEVLRAEFGGETIRVAHARFAANDRMQLDHNLLHEFGKNGQRPDAAIVVASQVVEQSLDIDFDAVITDLCPVDLLVQRLGRVHRHAGRKRPGPLKEPRCFITGIADPATIPPRVNGDSIAIYGEHVLLRTLASLNHMCGVPGRLTTPDHVPVLVSTVYGADQLGPDEWQPAMDLARDKALSKTIDVETFARRWTTEPGLNPAGLDSWLQDNDGEPDDSDPYNRERGRVRDGSESIEVMLVLSDGTGWRTLDWLSHNGGLPIPDEGPVPDHIAAAVANSSLRLPYVMSRGISGDAVISELEKLGRANFQLSPLLRGQLVLPLHDDIEATGRFHTSICNWTVTYDLHNGFQARQS